MFTSRTVSGGGRRHGLGRVGRLCVRSPAPIRLLSQGPGGAGDAEAEALRDEGDPPRRCGSSNRSATSRRRSAASIPRRGRWWSCLTPADPSPEDSRNKKTVPIDDLYADLPGVPPEVDDSDYVVERLKKISDLLGADVGADRPKQIERDPKKLAADVSRYADETEAKLGIRRPTSPDCSQSHRTPRPRSDGRPRPVSANKHRPPADPLCYTVPRNYLPVSR